MPPLPDAPLLDRRSSHRAADAPWPPPVPRRDPPWAVLVTFVVVAVAALLLYGMSIHALRLAALELLVGAAAAAGGGLIGFLFGIPRAGAQAPADDAAAGGRGGAAGAAGASGTAAGAVFRPSTSLDQVADWLTKILIGVGLVQLQAILRALARVGELVAATAGAGLPGVSVLTQAVVVTAAIVGFLPTYLWTRVEYGGIQTRADQEVLAALVRGQERQGAALHEQAAVLADQAGQLDAQATQAARALTVAEKVASGRLVIPRGAAGESAVAVDAAPPAAPAPPATDAALPRAVGALADGFPAALRDRLARFLAAPVRWDSDPVADLFGLEPAATGTRALEAEVDTVLASSVVVTLRVRRTDGPPLQGAVLFLLHPTFGAERLHVAPVRDGVAEIGFSAAEWFTVAAIADGGATVLARSLRTLPDVPPWFTRAG